MSVYPNPTNSTINFSVQTNVQLTNVTGQIVANKKNVSTLDIQ
ncbi:MAG: T9SS type A sorting domain-containing protein [Bacteroidetes bacterium]|nr:T9SS type A sorting domain-containing protein [Bacteroidota bacterium]